jgi:predicted HicB family RNase H-like nuclease
MEKMQMETMAESANAAYETSRASESMSGLSASTTGSLGTSADANEGTKKPSRSSSSGSQSAKRIAAELVVFQGVVNDVRAKLKFPESITERCKLLVESVAEFFGPAPTWTAFFRESLGRNGLARTLFPTEAEYQMFCESPEYSQVLEMLTALRAKNLPENDPTESQKMITIRIPSSLHDVICDEANAMQVSVNTLCISRMFQPLAKELMPASEKKRRGRRPGATYDRNESSE